MKQTVKSENSKPAHFNIVYGRSVKLVDNDNKKEIKFPTQLAMVEFVRDTKIATRVDNLSCLPMHMQGIANSEIVNHFRKGIRK